YLSFLTDAVPSEISPLSLHDALPIFELAEFFQCDGDLRPVGLAESDEALLEFEEPGLGLVRARGVGPGAGLLRSVGWRLRGRGQDRKSTRLNSSHEWISYAVFCLKKK